MDIGVNRDGLGIGIESPSIDIPFHPPPSIHLEWGGRIEGGMREEDEGGRMREEDEGGMEG